MIHYLQLFNNNLLPHFFFFENAELLIQFITMFDYITKILFI